jgi:hypothetical protein
VYGTKFACISLKGEIGGVMKTLKIISVVFLSSLLFSLSAYATPIPTTTWTDTLNYNNWITRGQSFTLSLDNFNPGDIIDCATLSLDIFGLGVGSVNIDNTQNQRYFVFGFNDLNIPLTCSVINDLSSTGLLTIVFNQVLGPQYLCSLSLTASGSDSNTAPVPEPGTLLLLGTGSVALVAYGRRRMRK